MRSLTLLELIVEWEQIPHEQFIVVRDTQLHTDLQRVTLVYHYQRGCVDAQGFVDIQTLAKRDASRLIEVHDKLPPGTSRDTTCRGCRGPLGYHWTEAQKAEIVRDALTRKADAHAHIVGTAG